MTNRVTSDVGPFAIVPLWLLQSGISSGAIMTYALLWAKWSDKQGECWPSHAKVASELKVTERSVKRYLAELTEVGALAIIQRRRDDGSQTSNLYTLLSSKPDRDVMGVGHECPGGEDMGDTGGRTQIAYELDPGELDPEEPSSSSPSAPQDDRDELNLTGDPESNEHPTDDGGDGDQGAAALSQVTSIRPEVTEAIRITEEQYGKGKTTPMLTAQTRGKPPCDSPWTAGLSTEQMVVVVRLAEEFSRLSHTVGGNRFENPFTQKAANPIKRLLVKDGFSEANIVAMIQWVTQDEFWSPNVRNHGALREKFDQLRGARNRDIKKRQAIKEREEANKGDGTTEDWMIRTAQRQAS